MIEFLLFIMGGMAVSFGLEMLDFVGKCQEQERGERGRFDWSDKKKIGWF